MPQDRKISYLIGFFYIIFNFVLAYVFFFNEKRDFSNYAIKSAELLKVNLSHLIEEKFCDFDTDALCKQQFTAFLTEKAKITNLLNISVFLPSGAHVYSSNEKIIKITDDISTAFGQNNVIQSEWMNEYLSISGTLEKVFVSTVAVKTPSGKYILIIDYNMTNEYETAWYDIKLYCWVVTLFSLFFFSLLGLLIVKNDKRSARYIRLIQKEKEHALSLSKIKENFLETMSHEIRTPINGFTGVLEILKSTLKDEKQKDLLDLGLHAAGHLKLILNDILDFGKLESGQIKIELTLFNLYENLDKFVKINTCSLGEPKKNLKINLDYKLEKNFFIKCDQLRLNQILQNLFSNAIKFTESGTLSLCVDLYTENEEEFLILTLKDSGIGIEKSKIDYLFEKFTQADASTSRLYGGTGLGLAITKKLVELLNGKITVKSKVGQGREFTVEIPLLRETVCFENNKVPKPLLTVKKQKSLKIMVVEDNYVNQVVLSSLLEKEGHKVTCVESGFKALELFEKENFHVIFMDIQMPDMDGIETTKRLRRIKNKKGRFPLIIACTADAFMDKADLNFDVFLQKPIDIQNLRELLQFSFLKQFR
jgi:signal transduction histidine kinase